MGTDTTSMDPSMDPSVPADPSAPADPSVPADPGASDPTSSPTPQ
jgi:hypothetical protein